MTGQPQNHPTELLAAFVDGSLSDSDRAALTKHLEGCPQCREEVRSARRAREALTSLPEVPAPKGLAERAVRRAPPGSPAEERSYRILWVGAAAALIVIVAWFGVRAMTKQTSPVNLSSGAEASTVPAPDTEPGPLDHDGNYDASEIAALTEQAAHQGKRTVFGNGAATGGTSRQQGPSLAVPAAAPSPAPAPAPAPAIKSASLGAGARCLNKAGAFDQGGSLVKVIQAKYNSAPAYIAVLYEPGPDGGPTDRAVTWVFAKSNCDVLDFSQHLFVLPSPIDSPFAPSP
jgi:hypothetical protein